MQPYGIIKSISDKSKYDIGIDWKVTFLLHPHSCSQLQTQKGVSKPMAQILITAYLVVGALAFALIWVALVASKRRENKAENVKFGRLGYNLFREPNAKPSRFQS